MALVPFIMILGLTGGMGCGKTTAARLFMEEGFGSIDSDALVHDLLAADSAVHRAIVERFGPDVDDGRGGIDRRRLGAIVFADDDALHWLESLLHPLVGARWREAVAREPDRPWVVQIPLLFEKKLEQSFDFTVCVGTSAANQRRRLMQKGYSSEEIARRVSRQLPLQEKTARADFFLLNDGSIDFLREQVQTLLAHLESQPRRSSA